MKMVSYDTVEVEDTLEDLLYKLIGCYLTFSERKQFPEELYMIHRKLALKFPKAVPYNIVDFFRILNERPLFEIFDSPVSVDFNFNDFFYAPLFSMNSISEAAYEFYIYYNRTKINTLQRQQLNMRSFLEHCRAQNDRKRYQQIYSAVRVNIYNKGFVQNGNLVNEPETNIYLEKEFEHFILKMEELYQITSTDEKLIRNFYRQVNGPKRFLICNHCHLPMFNENQCHNNEVCFSNSRKNRAPRRVVELEKGEVRLVPESGIIFYNVIPGLEEYRLYHKLKDYFSSFGVNVNLFPNLEKDGDIELTYRGQRILIDVKDYRKPEELADNINKRLGNFFDLDYVYIPQYRTKYNDYMKVLKDQVYTDEIIRMTGKKLQFVNEKQLIELVKKKFEIA
jgi:REase associating with pPIWI_RE